MRKDQEDHPELFEKAIDAKNKGINKYNLKVNEYANKIDEN